MEEKEPSYTVHASQNWYSLPTPVFLPGESHGQRSLVGHSPQGHKESDTTERLSTHAQAQTHMLLVLLFPFFF